MDKNIYQRMLEATNKIQTVAKNLSVQVNKTSSYKAVSELDILNAVKPIEIECGIYSYPHSRNVIETMVLESESNGYVRKQLFMRIETVYRFVNIENPTEYIDVTSYGDGIDSGDKATGKAMTYCDKYALMKAYKISTGDDPDQEASKELVSASSKTQTKATKDSEKETLVKEIMNFYGNNKSFGQVISTILAQKKKEKVRELDLNDLKELVEIARSSANSFKG